jgi:hypothetical protein
LEKRGGKAVLNGFLIATPTSQLRDSLDMNVQDFELLPDGALRHTPAKFLNKKPHTAFLREGEGVGTHTLLPIKGPHGADRGPESVRC